MDRQRAIEIIEGLFPPDAPYPDTSEVGQRLLEEAKQEVTGWRTEPDEVLIRFAQKCINEERIQASHATQTEEG